MECSALFATPQNGEMSGAGAVATKRTEESGAARGPAAAKSKDTSEKKQGTGKGYNQKKPYLSPPNTSGHCSRTQDMKKYKALIFDLDGTLADSLQDLWLSTNHALRTMGWPERTLDEVRRFVGNGVHLLIERAVPEGTEPQALERCFQEFRSHYVAHCMDHTAPYPGITDMLAQLDQAGYLMAIVSNKLQAGVSTMHRQHFMPHVRVAIGEHEGVRRKPAPDMVLEAIEALGAKAEECVYVGDSDVDLLTAQAADLPCLSVLWGFRDRDFLLAHGATTFMQSPSDIYNYMESH